MITQRIATAVRRQDWTIILIEFVLVIVGVLIALQLDQWNDSRTEEAQEIMILLAEKNALEQNISDMENYIRMLTVTRDFGLAATESLKSSTCTDRCWAELVAFFHASQWVSVGLSREVYDQMIRSGLPRDMNLKDKLASYYNIIELSRRVSEDLPRYRELVRSLIPAKLQLHLWTECFEYVGKMQTFSGDCESPLDNNHTRLMVEKVKSNAEIEPSLNYWLSTLTIVITTMHNQVAEAQFAIEAISTYIDQEQ